ncbi:MAG: aminotransferase class I/II-fold pyridoxal phosphate-dependent enzyme, partial [Paracoccaceae bacterium]
RVLLVLDGAYAEFADGYDGGVSLVEGRENVLMTRTFSKIYGLGGLRVGWGYGPAAVIGVLNRLRGPFNVTSASLAAAEAAVLDREHVAHCRAENAHWRDWVAGQLAAVGIPSDASMANFILARFGSERAADAADEFLRARGLIVRKVKGYKLPDCLRISIGDEDANRLLVATLADFAKGQG